MSNLNIQQKVSLAAQKSKETKVKDLQLSEAELRLKDFNENIKPNFTEEQTNLLEKYKTKLAPLGNFQVLSSRRIYVLSPLGNKYI